MERRLAAVLAADICDYSRLMGEDADAMLVALRRLRAELFGPSVASRRGRIVKNMGDGWIVLFGSAVDAVESAMQVQDRLATGAKPGEPEIRMRVGVHLGDVVEEDDDVFGDGVNVAARLEGATAPGSVAISEAVFGSLDGTLRPSFDAVGRWELKNIERPIQVWVRGEQAVAPILAGHKSEKLTIAVRPVTTSDDRAEVRELADAITGDVATYLQAPPWLFVSTTQTPGEAQYVLESTLRVLGGKLRLATRLDGSSDEILWSQKFDGDMADGFGWQDKVGEEIAAQVLTSVCDREKRALEGRDIADLSSSECQLLGQFVIEKVDAASIEESLKYGSLAIDKDPNAPEALYVAVMAHIFADSVGMGELVERNHEAFARWCKAAEPHRSDHTPLDMIMGITDFRADRDVGKLLRVTEKALRGNPSDYLITTSGGWIYVWLGEPQKAMDCFRRGLRLALKSPWRMLMYSGIAMAYLQNGQYENAVSNAETGVKLSPGYLAFYRILASANAHMGRLGDAHAALDKLFELEPGNSFNLKEAHRMYADTTGSRRYIDGLRLAGLPE